MDQTLAAPASTDAKRVLSVAVIGAAGRMGQTVCAAVEAADDMALVARIGAEDDLASVLKSTHPDVAVDFTVPDSTETNVLTCIDAGVDVVVGTTGWTAERLARLRDRLTASPQRGVVIAPNFGLSAVLASVFAAKAAQYFESVEVIEFHHPDKLDAPSGTARHTAEAIGAARTAAGRGPSPDATQTGQDARGTVIDGVHVHAVRLRGLVAHEEILLGNPGEQLTIRQDSFDRVSFMPGVLLAIRQVGEHPGLTVGLENLMDLG